MKKILFVLAALTATAAFGQESAGTSSWMNQYAKQVFYFCAVAFAAYGGTAAQSRAASVALEGIARNPSAADKIMTPMILGLALMESLVIFTLISVFLV